MIIVIAIEKGNVCECVCVCVWKGRGEGEEGRVCCGEVCCVVRVDVVFVV